MRRILSHALLGLITLLLSAQALANATVVRAGWNLRMQPNMDAEIDHTTREDQTASIVDQDGDWVLIVLTNGRRFWVYKDALASAPQGVGTADATGEDLGSGAEAGTINPGTGSPLIDASIVDLGFFPLASSAAVRNMPGTTTPGSEISGWVSRETPLTVVGMHRDLEDDVWYQVRYDDSGTVREGYIYIYI